MTKPHCDLPGWWTWKGNFALQTIWNDGGGGNWIPSQFPTMDDALAHIQRYIRKNRRILIWRENSEERTLDLVGYMKDKHSDVIEVKS